MSRRVYVLTISDSVAAGTREDRSGPAVQQRLQEMGWETEIQVLPDEPERISAVLRRLADEEDAAAVFTTGGTGIAARDRTPEATRHVIELEIPGIGEQMRRDGSLKTRYAALSRGLAGTRGRTLIVNLPGSPAGAVSSLDSVASILQHAIDLLEGRTEHTSSRRETEASGRTSQT